MVNHDECYGIGGELATMSVLRLLFMSRPVQVDLDCPTSTGNERDGSPGVQYLMSSYLHDVESRRITGQWHFAMMIGVQDGQPMFTTGKFSYDKTSDSLLPRHHSISSSSLHS